MRAARELRSKGEESVRRRPLMFVIGGSVFFPMVGPAVTRGGNNATVDPVPGADLFRAKGAHATF